MKLELHCFFMTVTHSTAAWAERTLATTLTRDERRHFYPMRALYEFHNLITDSLVLQYTGVLRTADF